MERIEKAKAFAIEKHAGQFRKGGKPYVTHPIAVAEWLAERGYSEAYILTGLFHDLLEDTSATEEEILALGGEEVLVAVKLLTKKKGYKMEEYLGEILKNPIAKAVKIADRIHNLQSLVEADEAFKARYLAETEEWYAPISEEIADLLLRLKK